MEKPEVAVCINDVWLTATYDNTVVVLFNSGTGDTLDHVCITHEGTVYRSYEGKLLVSLVDQKFPVLTRQDRPDWAIEAYIQHFPPVIPDILF